MRHPTLDRLRRAPLRLPLHAVPPLVLLVLAAIGCGDAIVAGTGGEDLNVGADLTTCVGHVCTGGCDTSADCKGGLLCDPASHACVACLGEGDCRPGEVCSPATHTCAPGCSASHACGDAGLCEQDAGVCVACLGDNDCRDPLATRCSPTLHQCVPCLPESDNCGVGTYCAAQQGGSFACSAGCKSDDDCQPSRDGGGGDPVNSDTHCDTEKHQCVRCVADGNCPIGQVCRGGRCADGCNAQRACPNGLTCCNEACTDVTSDALHCGACGNACAAGSNCCNSQCSDPLADVGNCGWCGNACSVPNGTPSCARGTCGVASCAPGWGDCNATPADGCETHTDVNAAHCGGCNNACQLDHAQARCTGGACQVQACLLPWSDCDGDPKNGCELNVQGADVMNCGACNAACKVAHATPRCDRGACRVAGCDAGWGDCNGNPADGCEVDLNTTVGSCGSCGVACTIAHGTPSCVQGACQVQSCDPGFADCDGNAANGCEINLVTDATNCNACGKVCPGGNGTPSCVNSACQIACHAGYANCDGNVANGCEINLASDVANCNGCGQACSGANGSPSCVSGACRIACNNNFGDCDGNAANGCEVNLLSSAGNCGKCGVACSLPNAGSVCSNGACAVSACNAGFADCDMNPANGCEVNITTSAAHCGACGQACSNLNGTPSCVASACQIACHAGFANCDGNVANGCEIDTATSVANCGSCGNACSSANGTPSCAGGACQIACNAGFADCDASAFDGCEVNLLTSNTNCGSCGAVCALPNAASACSNGACAVTACAAGFADCDGNPANGCEINLTSNVTNCGACGKICNLANATPVCTNGACAVSSCSAGFANCDGNAVNGCEINLGTSATNCGGCGKVCSNANIANPTCSAGTCNGQCNAGFADCNGSKLIDGCEINTQTDASNCGGCAVQCANSCMGNVSGTACTAGKCGVTACAGNHFDVDGQCGNGCECAGPTDSALCGTPTDLGTLPGPGNGVQRISNLVPIGREAWYSVTFTQASNPGFHPHIYLGVNPNNAFAIDVRVDCNTPLGCAEGGSVVSKTDWELAYTGGDVNSPGYIPMSLPGNNGTVLVRVYRVNGGVTCDSFTLVASE